jgi:hypothetical protein
MKMTTLSQHFSTPQADDRTAADTDRFGQAVIGVFDSHAEAERTIIKLQEQGYPIDALTLVGKGYHSEEHPLGFYTLSDRVKAWGGTGLVVGGLWGLVFGAGFFWFPEFTPMGLTEPILELLSASLEGAIAVGLITALGAALVSLLLPKRPVIRYAGTVKADRFLLMAKGDASQIETARHLMDQLMHGEEAALQA